MVCARLRFLFGFLGEQWASDPFIAAIGEDGVYAIAFFNANITLHFCKTILRLEAHLGLLHALWGAGFGGHHDFFTIFEKKFECDSYESSFWGD